MAFPCGLVLVLLAPNASALFVVNQPWLRPAARGQSTEAYMNLTSTDGANLVAVRTERCRSGRHSRSGQRRAAGSVIAAPGREPSSRWRPARTAWH